MVITLSSELEASLRAAARRHGVDPEALALDALRERFLAHAVVAPRDDWELRLLGVGKDCGVSLSDADLSSEGMYE